MISKVGKATADPRLGSDVVADDEVMLMLRSVDENRYGALAMKERPTVAAKPLALTPMDCADVIVTLGRLDGRTRVEPRHRQRLPMVTEKVKAGEAVFTARELKDRPH